MPVAAIIAAGLDLPRGYWVPLSATVILMPTFSGVFSRGAARVLGTCVGVGIAGLVAAAIHPTSAVAVLLVAVAAWGTYAFYQANYTVAATFMTALVLLMLSVAETNTTWPPQETGSSTPSSVGRSHWPRTSCGPPPRVAGWGQVWPAAWTRLFPVPDAMLAIVTGTPTGPGSPRRPG